MNLATRPVTRRLTEKKHHSRFVLWMVLVVLAIAITWAALARIDQTTRVQGQVIASSRTQVIQASEGGIIKRLEVREGDIVRKDQPLVYFEPARMEAAYLETQAKAAGLTATVARLRAEVFGGAPTFPAELNAYPEFRRNQLELFKKRRSSIDEDVASTKRMLALAKRELAMTEPLLKTGDVSMADIIRLERQVNDAQSQITNKQNKYFQDAQAELSKAEEDLAGVRQNAIQRNEQLKAMELRAPMNGVVKNVKFTTIGAVLRPGDELMQIVPNDDDLIVEVKVRPADIAFIKTGLDANVKIDAYDYAIYGWLNGKVSYISADTLIENSRDGEQTYYRAQIKISNRRFTGKPHENHDIQAGMTTNVEIKTGSNTVLLYLTKPIVKTWSESLHER